MTTHELRCLKNRGWQIVTSEPLALRHADESLATGQGALAVVAEVTRGQPNYEEMIHYDGRMCNCSAAEAALDAALEQRRITHGDDDTEAAYRECSYAVSCEHPSGEVRDAQGIRLTRACPLCVEEKLARYRPEILTGYTQSDVDEPIESDY